MAKKHFFLKCGVFALLGLASCAPAASSVTSSEAPGKSQDEPTSLSPTSEGQPTSEGGPTSQGQPTSEGGQTSQNQPTSFTDSPEGKYQVSQAYWTENITNLGYFGPKTNMTGEYAVTFDGRTMDSGYIANDYGAMQIHGVTSEGSASDAYIVAKEDGSYEAYAYNEGTWSKSVVPAAYTAQIKALFYQYIYPWEFSAFTYNPATHAYEKESDTLDFGRGSVLTAANISFKFEDNKLLKLSYDMVMNGQTAHLSVVGKNHGTTKVTLPEVPLTPEIVPVSAVRLSAETLSLTVGGSQLLTATVLPGNATDPTVTWKSSDDTIATVVGGLVVGVSEGTANITATAGEKSATCVVSVTAASQQTNPYIGVSLKYKAGSIKKQGAVMADGYTEEDIEKLLGHIYFQFDDDGTWSEDKLNLIGSHFVNYSINAEGGVDYAILGTVDVYGDEDYQDIKPEAYYSGKTQSYLHGDHLFALDQPVLCINGGFSYDATTSEYEMETYIAKSIDGRKDIVWKGPVTFVADAAIPALPTLPEDPYDDVYEKLVENTLFDFVSIDCDVSGADLGPRGKIVRNSTISFFEDGYAEYALSGYTSNGKYVEGQFILTGTYTVEKAPEGGLVTGDKAYAIHFSAEHLYIDGAEQVVVPGLFDEVFYLHSGDMKIVHGYTVSEGVLAYESYKVRANFTPTPYVPKAPDAWDAKAVAEVLAEKGYTDPIPSLSGVKSFKIAKTLKGFKIHGVMSTWSPGLKDVTDYMSFLVGDHGFTQVLDGGQLYLVSPNEQYKLFTNIITEDVAFPEFDMEVAPNTVEYPYKDVEDFLKGTLGTQIPMPALSIDAATAYVFKAEGDSGYVVISLKDGVEEGSVATYIENLLLDKNMFTKEGDKYVSKDRTYFITLTENPDSNIFFVNFFAISYLEPDPTVYPADRVKNVLAGVTETIVDFSSEKATKYEFVKNNGGYSGTLTVVFDSAEDTNNAFVAYQRVIAEFEHFDLVKGYRADGSGSLEDVSFEDVYVSPDKQYAIRLTKLADDETNSCAVFFINLRLIENVTYSGGDTPEATIVSIAVSDYKNAYEVGDEFAFDGTVTATLSDDSTRALTEEEYFIVESTLPDMTTAGTYMVTITLVGDDTISANALIVVSEPEPQFETITYHYMVTDAGQITWVLKDNPVFKVWAYGGSYGNGKWIDVRASKADDGITFTFNALNDPDANFILGRFDPTTEFALDTWGDTIPEEKVWNKASLPKPGEGDVWTEFTFQAKY